MDFENVEKRKADTTNDIVFDKKIKTPLCNNATSHLLFETLLFKQDQFFITLYGFFNQHLEGLNNVEIEAKFGCVSFKNTKKRANFHSLTDFVLDPQYHDNILFVSDIEAERYMMLQQWLNKSIEYHKGHVVSKNETLIDKFYHTKEGNIRVTHDSNDNILSSIRKKRIADIHLIFPRSLFDVRLSINTEQTAKCPYNSDIINTRKKHRITWKYRDVFKTDLSRILMGKDYEDPSKANKTYELEIELLNMDNFLAERKKNLNGDKSTYEAIIKTLLDNIRQMCFINNIRHRH